VFSHLLVLKNGKVLAAGKKTAVLNSKILSQTFGAKVKLQSKSKRYSMAVLSRSSAIT
jgi:ABC-type cobalamin/Fe3+-siderophores transport system ATPase subunit